jgi:hypothetical protein
MNESEKITRIVEELRKLALANNRTGDYGDGYFVGINNAISVALAIKKEVTQ